MNVLDFLKRPNANELVSGTKDRVNLYENFKNVFEASYPGTIDQLTKKTDEKKLPFWESVTDSKAGSFKFAF